MYALNSLAHRGGSKAADGLTEGRRRCCCHAQEELLRCLFTSLQKVASDSRPEVRNSAVRTLFAVMATTGGRLHPEAWEAYLWGLLFPLLSDTFHMAATSSSNEAEAAELGKVTSCRRGMVLQLPGTGVLREVYVHRD